MEKVVMRVSSPIPTGAKNRVFWHLRAIRISIGRKPWVVSSELGVKHTNIDKDTKGGGLAMPPIVISAFL
jgi:hypothetical protein